MSYAPGDTVVHRHHGTAVVTAVTHKDVGDGRTEYLELFVEHAALTIMVPAALAGDVGIRAVATAEHARDVLAVLAGDADVHASWSDRKASTVRRMTSGDPEDIAMVIRDLLFHTEHTGKPLSHTEKAAWDEAIDLLARELSVSLQLSRTEAAALIVERARSVVAEAVSADAR